MNYKIGKNINLTINTKGGDVGLQINKNNNGSININLEEVEKLVNLIPDIRQDMIKIKLLFDGIEFDNKNN